MVTYVSMSYSLIILFLVVGSLSCIDAEVRVTRRQLEEMDKYLERLNKPAVKSIKSPDGDTIDCVHISRQPAFDDPLLENHTIQMRPTAYPFGADGEDEVASEKELDSIEQPWHRYGRCPEDTIPIRRVKRDDLLRAGSPKRFLRLSQGTVSDVIHANAGSITERAKVQLYGTAYHGAQVVMNVWRPTVEKEEFSKSMVTVLSRHGSNIDYIDAGWIVFPLVYGDNNTRLSTFWSRGGVSQKSCYDLFCSGFVQTSNEFALGGQIQPISTYGGTQYEVKLTIWQDRTSGDWWLQYQNYKPLGYWPHSIFSSLGNGAGFIFWGGSVSRMNPNAPHTTTTMGSGHFPEEGYGKASFFRQVMFLNSTWGQQQPAQLTKLNIITRAPNCYNVTLGDEGNGDWGSYMYYGGPGRNPKCP